MNTHAAIGDQTVDPNEECPRCGSQPGERDATCPVCTDTAGQARPAFDLTQLTPTQRTEQAQANWAEHGECPRCGSSPGARDQTCPTCTDAAGNERATPLRGRVCFWGPGRERTKRLRKFFKRRSLSET